LHQVGALAPPNRSFIDTPAIAHGNRCWSLPRRFRARAEIGPLTSQPHRELRNPPANVSSVCKALCKADLGPNHSEDCLNHFATVVYGFRDRN